MAKRKTGNRKMVIDASVSLKWQLDDEEFVDQAVALRDDSLSQRVELWTATLWMYEIINGLVTATRRGRLPAKDLLPSAEDMLSLGVVLKTPDPIRVAYLAQLYQIAAYDSAYLALAEKQSCELWTGDFSFYKAVSAKLSWVRWIGNYPLHRVKLSGKK